MQIVMVLALIFVLPFRKWEGGFVLRPVHPEYIFDSILIESKRNVLRSVSLFK